MSNTPLGPDEIERRLQAIKAADGNISKAAQDLGMPRQRLSMWYHRHINGNSSSSPTPPCAKAPATTIPQPRKEKALTTMLADPELFLRSFLQRLDEARTELTLQSERVKELERRLARAEGDLSYYQDHEQRRREEWQREMEKRVAELSTSGD